MASKVYASIIIDTDGNERSAKLYTSQVESAIINFNLSLAVM